jgi:tRNA modification GTPase
MRLDTESTICAIATGNVSSLRGAIRLSGPDAIAIAASAFPTLSDRELHGAKRVPARVAISPFGLIDVSLFVWPNHRSYTGQPSVELHTLGNVVLLQSLQSLLVQHGARLAQPGEFTLRAFLAGRLDLTQCEAVLGVIHASNPHALQVALSQLAGGLSQPMQHLRTLLVHLLADIEAGLDFVDEDIEFISKSQILDRLEQGLSQVTSLLDQMDSRAAQSVALKVVLAGVPNAGKSSLANYLSQDQASMVSDEPGTTRDYVRHRLVWNGTAVDLLDTAGLETSDASTPRGMAQHFTTEQIRQADLILYCNAVNEQIDTSCQLLRDQVGPDLEMWLIQTKCDLKGGLTAQDERFHRCFSISLVDQVGLRELEAALQAWVSGRRQSDSQVVPATADRCRASLSNAVTALSQAHDACHQGWGDEIIASEIRLALEELGLVAGTVYTDDILDALFSRFCIGK